MNLDLSAEIRFRCPFCQKLFCTDSSVFSENTEVPAFECTDCHKDFLLQKEQLSTGVYKTQAHLEPVKNKEYFDFCPKCSAKKNMSQDECPSCGVIMSKFLDLQKLENPRLYELNKTWTEVVKNFDKDDWHQAFLNKAQAQSALNFAAQKYLDYKKIIGDDILIEKYLTQIEHRLNHQIQAQLQQSTQKTSESFIEFINSGKLFLLMAVFGTVIMIVNKFYPLWPNLNGLVLAITVLSYGLSILKLAP